MWRTSCRASCRARGWTTGSRACTSRSATTSSSPSGAIRAGSSRSTTASRASSASSRSTRAAPRLFGPHLPARFGDAMNGELGWLGAAIGAVRDLDVLFDTLQSRAARLDPDLRQALGPVALAIHEERAAALTALDRALAER